MSDSFRSSRKSDYFDLKTSTEEVKVMDKHGYASFKTPEAIAARREFRATQQVSIQISKLTRRILRQAGQQQRILARINKLRRNRQNRLANQDLRASVNRIKASNRAARRKPHMRVRSRDEESYLALPQISWQMNNGPVYKHPPSGWFVWTGIKRAMTDYTPIVRLDPPRNVMWANRRSRNSSVASAKYEGKSPQLLVSVPKCKFGALGLYKYPLGLDLTKNLSLDLAYVNKALIKVQAKIYSADIQTNEYLFEWKRVFRLLVDPYRTVLRTHRLLERWTRRNAWIWIPNRTLRRCGKGELVSKTPLGGMLMSMRTRKFIDPVGVSNKIFNEACNRWLQYRYGIMPLALDITKVMGDWVHPKLSIPRRSESARIWVSRTKESSDYIYTTSPCNFKFRVTKETGTFYSVKQWYKILEEPPMSYKLGVHPSQWINALWNGLPWSFVADWVVNIDDYLKATTDVPWIELGPNVCTLKQFERVRSRCSSITYTNYPYPPLTVDGAAIASAFAEKVARGIDYPRAYQPVMSNAWQTVKNAATALALLPKAELSTRTYGRAKV